MKLTFLSFSFCFSTLIKLTNTQIVTKQKPSLAKKKKITQKSIDLLNIKHQQS